MGNICAYLLRCYIAPEIPIQHSKKICLMLHQKEAVICWLQKLVLSCTIIDGKLHQKMVKCSDKSTKVWLNCVSQQISVFFFFFFFFFWRNIGQNVLECNSYISSKLNSIPFRKTQIDYYFENLFCSSTFIGQFQLFFSYIRIAEI